MSSCDSNCESVGCLIPNTPATSSCVNPTIRRTSARSISARSWRTATSIRARRAAGIRFINSFHLCRPAIRANLPFAIPSGEPHKACPLSAPTVFLFSSITCRIAKAIAPPLFPPPLVLRGRVGVGALPQLWWHMQLRRPRRAVDKRKEQSENKWESAIAAPQSQGFFQRSDEIGVWTNSRCESFRDNSRLDFGLFLPVLRRISDIR